MNLYKIFLLVLALTVPALAQGEQTPAADERSAADESQAQDRKIDYLQNRLESSEQYQQDLLATMEWVVGTSFAIVLTVTVVVVGLGWYTNFRLYKGDLEQIRQEQERKYEAHVESLKNDVGEYADKTIASGLERAKSEATKSANAAVKGAIRDIRELQLKMMHMEAKDWERRKVDANALYTLALAMPIAVETGGQYLVDEIAEEMERILSKKSDHNYMDSSLAQNLIDSLKSIEGKYNVVFESLTAKIKRSAGIS